MSQQSFPSPSSEPSVGFPVPINEAARLDALRRYDILDTIGEQGYDDVVLLASHILRTPMALISFIDENRQWFKAKVGLVAEETPRELAFCAHTIMDPSRSMVVRDATQDHRFAQHPMVQSPDGIRFYLGAPLVTSDQHAIGTLCVVDKVPRNPSRDQVQALEALSRQVVAQLELRRMADDLRRSQEHRESYLRRLESYQRQLEAANAQLRRESRTDMLTGVPNHGAFQTFFEDEVCRSVRRGLDLTLILVDVDNFKSYNDCFGHPAGDAALRLVAGHIQANLRADDFLARYGGEEFAVVLPETSSAAADTLAERLRGAIEAAEFPHRRITLSIGVCTRNGPDIDGGKMILLADQTLYRAKEGGRNRVEHAEPL